MARFSLALLFTLLSTLTFAASAPAQTGPCTEKAVKAGDLPYADDLFTYMPPYGKPASGKAANDQAAEKSFSTRINRKFDWGADHRVVATASGDMAYEHGTMHVSYDDTGDGKHHQFDAVMLNVFKASGAVCQQVAMTMNPLEDTEK